MPRTIAPADAAQVEAARRAVALLREARDLLVHAGSPRAADRVRLALTSAGGAVRHVERRSSSPLD